jgi:GNAT superfamily N-acetyltransferase
MADVRRALLDDAPLIASIQIEAWQKRLSQWADEEFIRQFDLAAQTEKYKKRSADPNQTVLVAEDKMGRVVGVIGARPNEEASEYERFLFGFYVRPDLERQGIGTGLLNALLETEAQNGDRKIIVFTFADNFPARRRYQACGGALLSFTTHPSLADLGLAHVSYGF